MCAKAWILLTWVMGGWGYLQKMCEKKLYHGNFILVWDFANQWVIKVVGGGWAKFNYWLLRNSDVL